MSDMSDLLVIAQFGRSKLHGLTWFRRSALLDLTSQFGKSRSVDFTWFGRSSLIG